MPGTCPAQGATSSFHVTLESGCWTGRPSKATYALLLMLLLLQLLLVWLMTYELRLLQLEGSHTPCAVRTACGAWTTQILPGVLCCCR